MKQDGNENDEGRPQSDDDRRDFDFGWSGWFGIHLSGLSQLDVKCMAIAISSAIVATVLIFGFTQIWDRVATLWE